MQYCSGAVGTYCPLTGLHNVDHCRTYYDDSSDQGVLNNTEPIRDLVRGVQIDSQHDVTPFLDVCDLDNNTNQAFSDDEGQGNDTANRDTA